MSETLTYQKPVHQHAVEHQSQDFHLPGDSHVAKGIEYDTKTGEFMRKVITPNHLGQLAVKYLPHEEVVAVRNSRSYDHLDRH